MIGQVHDEKMKSKSIANHCHIRRLSSRPDVRYTVGRKNGRRVVRIILLLCFCVIVPSRFFVVCTTDEVGKDEGSSHDGINDIIHPDPISEHDVKIAVASSLNDASGHTVEMKQQSKKKTSDILLRAAKRGLGGGLPGALAGVIQVLTLMWLRTVINYQCRYGTSFFQALKTLLKDGGIARLYRGLSFALIQAPLARFVSTAANDAVLSLVAALESTKTWGPGRTTVIAAFVVGCGRIVLMPIDTMKVVLQVDGTEGFRSLIRRLKAGRFSLLYQGAMATAVSAVVGHYPWFFTYNWLSAREWIRTLFPSQIIRNGAIGLAASVVADVIVNALRVIKTTKQSLGSQRALSYVDTVRIVLAADGWKGLFGRGLRARIVTNALQSILFTIVWRGVAERWNQAAAAKTASSSSEKDTYPNIRGRSANNEAVS